ncbi:MAG: hypothetical protein KGL93_04285 [Gemmatimonadota bacterium]|nr:hypothetical protein [Gemmatimonadota bacterium]HEU4989164.1 hypothetical protein [Gemmatimonadaceae bacterium]
MRFQSLYALSLGILASGLAGCASGSGGAGGSSIAADAASGKIGPALLQWSGTFRPTQQQTGTFGGLQSRNQATGTVVLTAQGPSQTHVRMSISIGITDPVRLPWSLATGGCGSNTIPLMAVSQFPEVTASNGRARLDDVISIPLPTAGSYHVNVFNSGTSGQDESEVYTCADLTLERRGT